MIKKFINYQRLLLNSIPAFELNTSKFSGVLFIFMIIMFFINGMIFSGNIVTGESFILIDVPIISFIIINRILHGNCSIYEIVPVNKIYILINIFILPIVNIGIAFIGINIFSVVFFGLIVGVLYLVNPQGISDSPPETQNFQIIDSINGHLLMVCLCLIIIFVGITIALIKNKRQRLFSYGGFAIISYGLLFLLKSKMPVSPNTGCVEFIDSFSIMPGGNIILIYVTFATVVIAIASVLISYNIYVRKEMQVD